LVKRQHFGRIAGVLLLAASIGRADTVDRPDFTNPKGAGHYTLVKEGAGKPSQLVAGDLILLDGEPNQKNALVLDRTASGLYRHIDLRWNMTLGTGGDTASCILLNTATAGLKGAPTTSIGWIARRPWTSERA